MPASRPVSLAGREMTRLTTTQRGLGAAHQRARRLALATLEPGTQCPRCPLPMYPAPALAAAAGLARRYWYLDLDDFPGRVYGGPQTKLLAHRTCNRAAGARVANSRRAGKPRRIIYDRW